MPSRCRPSSRRGAPSSGAPSLGVVRLAAVHGCDCVCLPALCLLDGGLLTGVCLRGRVRQNPDGLVKVLERHEHDLAQEEPVYVRAASRRMPVPICARGPVEGLVRSRVVRVAAERVWYRWRALVGDIRIGRIGELLDLCTQEKFISTAAPVGLAHIFVLRLLLPSACEAVGTVKHLLRAAQRILPDWLSMPRGCLGCERNHDRERREGDRHESTNEGVESLYHV